MRVVVTELIEETERHERGKRKTRDRQERGNREAT
jgi:hypothetical protein